MICLKFVDSFGGSDDDDGGDDEEEEYERLLVIGLVSVLNIIVLGIVMVKLWLFVLCRVRF